MKYTCLFTVASLLFVLVCDTNALLILEGPNNSTGQFIASPRLTQIGPADFPFDIVASVVLAPNETSHQNLTSKCFLVDVPFGESTEHKARSIWNTYAEEKPACIIYGVRSPSVAGSGDYVRDGSKNDDVLLPAVQISQYDMIRLVDLVGNGTVFVRVRHDDINLWDDMAKSPLTHIYFSVFLGGLTVFIACFSVYKLVLFIRYQGFGLTVPVLSLVMIIISCILRLIHLLIDPVLTRKVFGYVGVQLMYTINFSFVLVVPLLITLFVSRLMAYQSGAKVKPFLKKLQVPFWVIFVLLVCVDIAQAIVRGLNYNVVALVYLYGVLYFVLALGIAIYFFVLGFKMIRMLKRSSAKTNGEKITQRLRSTTYRILASGFGLVAFAILIIILGVTNLIYQPWPYWAIWALLNLSICFISAMLVAAFNAPTGDDSSKLPTTTHALRSRNGTGTTRSKSTGKSDDTGPSSAGSGASRH